MNKALDCAWPAPFWAGYRHLLESLKVTPDGPIPAPAALNVMPGGGVEFVDSDQLGAVDYEHRIFETGQVSTRADNWHDLFNALVWMRFPAAKAAMNALHIEHWDTDAGDGRGTARDALTLFDESGVVVVSRDRQLLDLIQEHRWEELFLEKRGGWGVEIDIAIVGHAILEKLLTPYKALTARALLLHRPAAATGDLITPQLDREVADWLHEGDWSGPADLPPLPLMGIPGWWPGRAQNAAFYADENVFRQASTERVPS